MRRPLKNTIILILVLCSCIVHPLSVFGQAKKFYKEGKEAYTLQQYKKATELLDKAIKELEAKRKDHKLLPECYEMRGWSNFNLRNYIKCVPDAEKAIQLKPDYQGYHHLLGASLVKLLKCREAIEPLKKAVDIEKGLDAEPYPKIIDVYIHLGICYAWMNDPEQAEYYYDKAAAIEKGNNLALIERSKLYGMHLKTVEKAIEEIKSAYRVSIRDPYGLMIVGDYLLCQKEFERSRARYLLAGKLGGNEITSLFYVAQVYKKEDKLVNMQDTYDKILEKTPKSAEDYKHFAKVYVVRNKPEEAMKAIDKAVELSGCKWCMQLERASVMYDLKKFKESKTEYDAALEEITPNASILVKAAKTEIALNLNKEAEKHLMEAILVDKEYPEAYYTRGKYGKQLGRYDAQICNDLQQAWKILTENLPCSTELTTDMVREALGKQCGIYPVGK